ncbi:MAG: Fe-S-containing protein [Candidatus Coprovivens sp.]
MKKISLLLFLIIIFLTGCNTAKEEKNKYINATLLDDNRIAFKTEDITSKTTFINYEVDNITIQLIAVKASDNTIRVSLNTCQSCSPAPLAYFKEEGEYLVCQNCGTKFHKDDIGKTAYGCNPIPIEEIEQTSEEIIITKDKIEKYKSNFENWAGPIQA